MAKSEAPAENVNEIDLLKELAALKAEIAELKAKDTVKKAAAARRNEEKSAYWNEQVEVRLFKDSGKYKDDVTVCVNGKVWQIKRGMSVKVPRKVKMVLDRSYTQDMDTAMLMDRQEREFLQETQARGI